MGVLYEDLNNVPVNNNVIPESCLSFFEQAMYVAEFAQDEHNNLIRSLSIRELREFEENGGIYTESNEEIIMEGVKEKMTKTFGVMKKVFDNINMYFKTATANGKKVVAQITPEKINNCPENLGKTHTFFDFKKVPFAKNGIKFAKKVNSRYAKVENDKEKIKALSEEIAKEINKEICGIDSIDYKSSIGKLKKVIRKELIGEEIKVDKAFVKKNFNRMKDIVAGDAIPANVKQFYNDQKSLFDSICDECYVHEKDNKDITKLSYWEASMIAIYMTVFAGLNVAFDVYKRMHREYLNILIKVANSGKKVVKEDAYTDKMQQNLDKMKQSNQKNQETINNTNSVEDDFYAKYGIKREDDEIDVNSEPSDAQGYTDTDEPEEFDGEIEEGMAKKILMKTGKTSANSPFGKAGIKIGKEIVKKRMEKEQVKEEVTPEDIEDDEPDFDIEESTYSLEYSLLDGAFDF